jgi:hypothetical protein
MGVGAIKTTGTESVDDDDDARDRERRLSGGLGSRPFPLAKLSTTELNPSPEPPSAPPPSAPPSTPSTGAPFARGLKILDLASSYSCCLSSYVFFFRLASDPAGESESEPPEVEFPREDEPRWLG